MNDLSIAAKLLFTVACAALTLGAVGSLGHLTYKMADAAVTAQQSHQMSYGAFSRQLWASRERHK
jgi:hypothetical protein